MHYADSLILDIATTGRDAAETELAVIAAYVASRGFDPSVTPTAHPKLGQRGAGLTWQGRTYASNERVPNGLRHYLLHVVGTPEWPAGTTIPEYEQSLAAAVREADAAMHLSLSRSALWQLHFFTPSRRWRGPAGAGYILVGYPLNYGWWSTGFQVELPQGHADAQLLSGKWQGGRWLRLPK